MNPNEAAAVYAMIKEAFATSNKISDYCFNDCVMDFNYSKLDKRESSCIDRCVGRYVASKAITEKGYIESALYLDKTLKMGVMPGIAPLVSLPRTMPDFMYLKKQKSK